jgi:hypothetical protein
MMRTITHMAGALLLTLGFLACSDPVAEAQPTASATPPHAQPGAALPGGHPPLNSTPGGVPAPPANSGAGADALSWQPPEGWNWVQPANAMRRAQYQVPGPEGDAECVVYYFGPGQGGDAASNAARWASQFSQPDGRPSQEVMETEKIMVGEIPVLLIRVTGSYSGGMPGMGGGGQPQSDQMLIGAVAEGPDANWFFKMTGPEATVSEQREAFEGMIRSLAPGGDAI